MVTACVSSIILPSTEANGLGDGSGCGNQQRQTPVQRLVAAMEAQDVITLDNGGADLIPNSLSEDQGLHKEHVRRWQPESRGGCCLWVEEYVGGTLIKFSKI